MVSSVTLPATAAVLQDGVTCQVSNEHGAESKVVPVAVKTGQLLLPFMGSCHTVRQQLPNEPHEEPDQAGSGPGCLKTCV